MYQLLQVGEWFPVELRRAENDYCTAEAQIIGCMDNMFIGRVDEISDDDHDYHEGDNIAFFVESVDENGFPNFVADISPSRHITAEMLEDGAVLKEAIKTFNDDRTEPNFIEVLQLLRDSYVWIPCNAVMSEADQQNIKNVKVRRR